MNTYTKLTYALVYIPHRSIRISEIKSLSPTFFCCCCCWCCYVILFCWHSLLDPIIFGSEFVLHIGNGTGLPLKLLLAFVLFTWWCVCSLPPFLIRFHTHKSQNPLHIISLFYFGACFYFQYSTQRLILFRLFFFLSLSRAREREDVLFCYAVGILFVFVCSYWNHCWCSSFSCIYIYIYMYIYFFSLFFGFHSSCKMMLVWSNRQKKNFHTWSEIAHLFVFIRMKPNDFDARQW